MTIWIIGSGKVATFLGTRLRAKGYVIGGVYSRTVKHARALAQRLQCAHTTNLKAIPADADVYLIALTDAATLKFASGFKNKNALVLHTSGSLSKNIFYESGSAHTGVLYPMFSFSSTHMKYPSDIPVFIEAADTATLKRIKTLAKALSKTVMTLSSEDRFLMHLSAVFANNFTNHMFSISEEILKKNKLKFTLLVPMILQSVSRLQNESPAEIQTGPAKRGDKQVLKKHSGFLKAQPEYKKIYDLLSKSIIKKYHSGKKK